MPALSSTAPRWRLRELDEARVEALARARGLPPVVARVLLARGHGSPEDADRHLEPSLMALHDPARLPDMGAACARLARALRDGETLLVHGDYDVDGVTGTALLVRLLNHLGARFAWHIPNRFTDGYAFGAHSVERARDVGAGVVISVDNGTSSRETIAELAELGIDTVVTDHHEPPLGALPPAAALVNPKLDGSEYPFRELCGGAVAFKLAWGLCQELSGGERVRADLRALLLDLMAYVAIATVCDVVPLVDENRVLAHYGLRALEASEHAGLKALLDIAGLKRGGLRSDDVGFQIGPRINAAGRLGSARTALELLMCADPAQAKALALELDRKNQERRELERALLADAVRAAEPFADPDEHPVLVLAGQGWHQGVVGIVAARLVGRYGRPAVVIGLDGARGKGSGRTVPGVDLLEVLHGGRELLPKYGGHAAACGLEIESERVDDLRALLCERARELHPGGAPPQALDIDAELPFAAMDEGLMRHVDRLEPFGERNEKPVFVSRDPRLAEPPRAVGADRSHLMLQLRSGAHVMKAMAFGMGARAAELEMGRPLDVVYTPRWNTFRGTTALELQVLDFRVPG